ncbi:MAG: DUF6268 family outer membrane beta-barrel protein [Chitinophagaceae bacterium]
MKRLLYASWLFIPFTLLAQDSTKSTTSFSFEDVDNTPIKVYCNQKITNQTPNRFISIGYELQTASTIKINNAAWNDSKQFNAMQGIRLNVNTPLVSTNQLIVNAGAQFARTAFNGNINAPYPLYNELVEDGLHTSGVQLTMFKPLNAKNFFIFQTSVDANWLAGSVKQMDTKAATISATAMYGWKKSDNEMIGLGVSRTYRLGRLIYVPVVLWNKTFNDQWGVEATFPAKAHVRRNINSKSLLQFGYELEGNQYAIYTNKALFANTYLQRGEIKPRFIYERSIVGFWWLSIQAGLRINGRMHVVDTYNGSEKNQLITTQFSNPLYFNVSINLVSL